MRELDRCGQAPAGTLEPRGLADEMALKIAMVAASPFPYPQGSQVLIGQLARELQKRGHAVCLVTYHHGLGSPPDGVEIRRISALPGMGPVQAGPSWRKPLLDLLLTRKLLHVVREQGCDLMHAHNFEGLLAALAVRLMTGVPVIYHIHNAMGLELHTYFRCGFGRWAGHMAGRWVDWQLPRRADCCIVLDHGAVDYFRQRGVKRLRVVAPGIDYEPGQAARALVDLSPGPLVLYSGNLDPYQDLNLLLRAFTRVAMVRPDAQLVLSTNRVSGRWRLQADDLGIPQQVQALAAGDFAAVRDLLAAADVAVCPRSSCLGFPIKLLNYMAAGKAIVVSEGSACGIQHLESGWVVDNGDTEAMAAAILTLLDNPELADRLGKGARRTAASRYTWARAGDAIEEIYMELVGRRIS